MQRQFAQLAQMSGVDVTYSKAGTAREIKGKTGVKLPKLKERKVGEEAPEVLANLRDILLAAGTEKLTVFRNDQLVPAMRTITLKQSIRGIPVEGAVISLSMDPTTGEVTSLFNYFVPDRNLPRKPAITSAKAIALAKEAAAQRDDVEPASIEESGQPELRYYGGGAEPEQPVLVWAVNLNLVLKTEGNESSLVLVDAVSGAIKHFARTSYKALPSAYIYSANNATPHAGNDSLERRTIL